MIHRLQREILKQDFYRWPYGYLRLQQIAAT